MRDDIEAAVDDILFPLKMAHESGTVDDFDKAYADARARLLSRAALAAPATGDAGAMREACAAHLRALLSHEQDMVVHALEVRPISTESLRDAVRRAGTCEGYRLAEAAIRALPLPAPASGAVEEARATATDVVVALIEWAAPKIASKNGAIRQEGHAVMRALKETIDKDSLAAATAVAAEAAAKGNNQGEPK